jgi:hypothetical protein
MTIDTILGLIGLVLGILGILTGYIFYRKSLRLREPCFFIIGQNLIQDNTTKFSGLEVSFKGQKIENLTVSKILFWNHGYETIEKSDIVPSDPLRIEGLTGIQILDANIITTNNSSSQFLLKPNTEKRWFELSFDYLDKDNGVIIQVVHTGKASNDVIFLGKVKGANINSLGTSKKVYLSSWIIAFSVIFLMTVFSIVVFKISSIVGEFGGWIGGTYLLLLFVIFPTAMARFMRWLEPKLSNFPKEFNSFIASSQLNNNH